jgi:dinuclear metal center YbgI/SA1388 family protein
MRIAEIITQLEYFDSPALAEDYDNVGLLVGNPNQEVTGILLSLDCIEATVQEAMDRKCNVIIAHHPILFKGIKSLTGKNYVERTLLLAIKNDIAIYAIHTNLDNILAGVNAKFAEILGLEKASLKILQPKKGLLKKLIVHVPERALAQVEVAVFEAGAGDIGNYSHCSFKVLGQGSYMPNEGANPETGSIGKLETGEEYALEVVFPAYLESKVVAAAKKAHVYEEVAYQVISLDNVWQEVGAGMIGELAEPMSTEKFLDRIKEAFNVPFLKHTAITTSKVQKVALCGGSGSFLTKAAIAAKADIYITADIKYHEFFDADNKIILLDIGHYESEQFTSVLIQAHLSQKIANIAVLLSEVNTNPVKYR